MTAVLWLAALAAGADVAPETPVNAAAEAPGVSSGGPTPPAEAPPAGPDRSAPPPVADPFLLELRPPEVHEIAPGIEARLVRVTGGRKVVVQVLLRRGLIELDGGSSPAGSAAGWLADAAAGGLSGAELSERSDLHDVTLTSGVDLHDGAVSVEVPLEDLAVGLDLQRRVLRDPTFAGRDLRRYREDQRLFYTVTGPTSQATLAGATLAYGWFPADHPYGTRPDPDAIARLKRKDLRDRWQRWIHEAPLSVLVVGNVTWDVVRPALTEALDGLGRPGEPSRGLPHTPPPGTRVLAVDLPGQDQVAIRLRTAAPARDAADAPAATALDDLLGGQFLSRLNRNLREDKGLTYGASSRYQRGEGWGTFTVSVDVGAQDLGVALTEIERELARLVDEPVTDDERATTRQLFAAAWNRTLETPQRAADRYARAWLDGQTLEQALARQQAVMDATAEQLQAVARAHLGADQPRLWVVVGDRAAVEPVLAERGWQARWLAPTDAILGNF